MRRNLLSVFWTALNCLRTPSRRHPLTESVPSVFSGSVLRGARGGINCALLVSK